MRAAFVVWWGVEDMKMGMSGSHEMRRKEDLPLLVEKEHVSICNV